MVAVVHPLKWKVQVQAGQTLEELDVADLEALEAPWLAEAHPCVEVKGTKQQAATGHGAQRLAEPNWELALELEAQPSVGAGASELCPHQHPQRGRHQISHG